MGAIVFGAVLLLSLTTQTVICWTWNCDRKTNNCRRVVDKSGSFQSVEECRLVCGHFGGLWPKPTGSIRLGNKLIAFNSNTDFKISASANLQEYLTKMVKIFQQNLLLNKPKCCTAKNKLTVNISVNSNSFDLNWDTNETYTLDLKTVDSSIKVTVQSETVFGARHALETLGQLIVPRTISGDKDESDSDSESNSNSKDESKSESKNERKSSVCWVTLESAYIRDCPAYSHRGLLLDCSRNYVPVKHIKKHIAGMGASKMNYLHWHVTDTQSWPLEIDTLPNMTKYGAYSKELIYSKEDVDDLREYALLRGVQIIIEIDAPSHSGNGWNWGPEAGLGNLAVCVNQAPFRSYCIEPPCGQLNPANEKLYDVLETLYQFINDNYPNSVFHMGGDELFIPCWNSTDEIIQYLNGKPRTTDTFLQLWSEYQLKALSRFDETKGHDKTSIIVWTSHLTDPAIITNFLPKSRYIIQSWVPSSDELPKQLAELGYRLIITTKNAWYLDHGFWGGTPYYDWKRVYDNKILNSDKVLGGEVCMWGEFVEYSSMEARVWPRASAAAERLWSNPDSSSADATVRFYRQRERLVRIGIGADAVGPRWCYQNEGAC